MHILMIGAGNPPSTFISRQINILERNQVKVSILPEFKSHKYANTLLSKKGFIFHLPKKTLDLIKDADIIHYQWPGHLLTHYSLAKRLKKPAVLSLRGRQINVQTHMPGCEKYVERIKRMVPRCSAYHCVSEDISKVAENYGLDPNRSWVIRPAVDTSFFTPPSRRPTSSPIQIAMVGALIWRKGYEYALQALRQLLDQGLNVKLIIVGAGSEIDRIRYTVSDLVLGGQVVLAGSLPPEGVRDVLQESHIFLLTSLSEGIANVVLEAMACGLPVVTTDASGMREAVTDGVEGFVVPLRDVDLISSKLYELIQNAELRCTMGEEARYRTVHEFDLKDQGRKFLEMYRFVLGQ